MKKILILSVLFVAGCDSSATKSDSSDSIYDGVYDGGDSFNLTGTWNVTSATSYPNATCTEPGGELLTGYWTSVAVNYECTSTACTRNMTLTCSGCSGGSTSTCCDDHGDAVIDNNDEECLERSYTSASSTITFTTNAYCDDCTSPDRATCETSFGDWDEASNMTATLTTANTFVLQDVSEAGCEDDNYSNQTDCENAGYDWDEAECERTLYTKQ